MRELNAEPSTDSDADGTGDRSSVGMEMPPKEPKKKSARTRKR